MYVEISNGVNVNCDAVSNNVTYILNSVGWRINWGGTQLRLVRNSDSSVMGVFPQALSCNVTSGSSSPTPSIDEDCDGLWDNQVSQQVTSCANGSSGGPAPTCGATICGCACSNAGTPQQTCTWVWPGVATQITYY